MTLPWASVMGAREKNYVVPKINAFVFYKKGREAGREGKRQDLSM